VATHSDCPEVFVWNIENQPNRCEKGPTASTELSRPDLKLVGHKKNAEFALATSITAPIVASGGTDNLVCLWSLADSASVSSGEGGKDGDGLKVPSGRGSWNSGVNGAALAVALGPSPTLAARAVFEGHTATVEDVAFHPFSETQLCSVDDDASLLFWDALSVVVVVSLSHQPGGTLPAERGVFLPGPAGRVCVWREGRHRELVGPTALRRGAG